MPQLTIQTAQGVERRIPLGVRATIGRGQESDIRFYDRLISRRHAEIRRHAQHSYLLDTGSTNGTFLNGSKVSGEAALADGDVIVVGGKILVFHDEVALADGSSARIRAVSELVRDNRVLRILSQATAALLVDHPLPQLFGKILDLVMEAIPAERGTILILEGNPPSPVAKASRTRTGQAAVLQPSSTIVRRAVNDRAPLLLPDVLEHTTLKNRQSIVSSGIRSALCAPLWVASSGGQPQKVLGLVYLDTRGQRSAFSEADLEVLTALANVAAAKIENARLLSQSLDKQRLEDDLRLAARIQARVLPHTIPELAGYQIAAASHPCRTVGGDYHDLFFDGERVHVALGDVSGNGLGAGMLMIALRTAVRAHWCHPVLAQAVERINETFHENVPDDKFATLFVARIDARTGGFVYVNAGHDRPLLVRADGTSEPLAEGGTILGAFEHARYHEAAADLEVGDILVIFSDGVSDAWPVPAVAEQHLADVVRQNRHRDAVEIQRAILDEVASTEHSRPPDDCTLVVLKRTAPTSA